MFYIVIAQVAKCDHTSAVFAFYLHPFWRQVWPPRRGVRLPHVRVNAGGIELLATFATLHLLGFGTRTTDVFFRDVLVVVFTTARAGAKHRPSHLCETLCFRNLFGDVWELARLRTLLQSQILSAAFVPVNTHGVHGYTTSSQFSSPQTKLR